MSAGAEAWRACSSCKKPLAFGKMYWACSVSTCNRRGTSFAFCSVDCWDKHVPLMNHRDAWAEERRAPRREEWERTEAEAFAAARRKEDRMADTTQPQTLADAPRETLVVASKVKAYIRARSGFNTSDKVLDVLSDKVRAIVDEAIGRAQADGRKTVLDRDFD